MVTARYTSDRSAMSRRSRRLASKPPKPVTLQQTSHRCYALRPWKKGWQCRNVFPALTPDLPWKFIWPERSDIAGLKKYIDALLLGNRSEAVMLETAGAVQDVEMYQLERPDSPIVRINANRFVDMMLLRDHFDVPLWGRVHFVTDGESIIPRTLIAALGQMLGEDGQHLDATKPWRHCTAKDLKAMGLKESDVTSSMYRDRVTTKPWMDTAVNATAAPDVAPREIEVHRRDHHGYFDLVTQVLPEGHAPYYTRRVIDANSRVLWVATSYQLDGPWKIWKRESAELMALGLSI